MKFIIVYLFLMLNLLNLKAQTFDTTFVKQVGVEICDCLSKQVYSTDGMEEYFYAFQNLCAVEILNTKYIDKLDEFQAATKDNGTNISVDRMFYEFFNLAQVVMIDDCDLVFEFYETQKLRNAQVVRNLYSSEAVKVLVEINQEIEEKNQPDIVTLRGLTYFSIDSLKQAEIDLKPRSENAEAKDFAIIQLYAHILELNGKFDEAVRFYEDIVTKQPIPFKFYLAVTKRKRLEALLDKD